MRAALKLAIASLALALTAPIAASAATATHGVTTANVNFRSGPDTGFPSVAVIPYGAPVVILGCLDDRSWCDVAWAGERGWVHAAYLQSQRDGYRPLPYPDPVYAAPVIGFDLNLYWNDHYRSRPWFAERNRYSDRRWDERDWNRNDNRRGDGRRDWDDRRNGGNDWSNNDWSNDGGNWNQNGRNGRTELARPGDDGVIYFDPNSGGTRGRPGDETCRDARPDVPGFQPNRACRD